MVRRESAVATRAARTLLRKEEFARHTAQWRKGNDADRRDAQSMPSAEKFARHMTQRLNYAVTMVARSMPRTEEMALRRNNAATWDAPTMLSNKKVA